MKKFLSFLLALSFFIIGLSGCDDTSEQPENEQGITTTATTSASPDVRPAEDFQYEENSDGTIAITLYTGSDADVVIPDAINEKEVSSIRWGAFSFQDQLISVTIPNTVTVIDSACFQKCKSLKTVVLSENLVDLGASAFQYCESLTEITLPERLTEINPNTFDGCIALKHITIPNNVSDIKTEAFFNSGLETITFGNSVLKIHSSAFSRTPIKSIVLPPSLQIISARAFEDCRNLKSVTLNEGLQEIDTLAFAGCVNLEELTIPFTVNSMIRSSVSGCTSFHTLRFEGDAPNNFLIDSIEALNLPYTEFTIYYHEGAEGFTSPEWNGHKTTIW